MLGSTARAKGGISTAPPSMTTGIESPAGSPDPIRASLSDAARYLTLGQFDDALHAFRSVLGIDGTNLEAMLGVALCHDRQGHLKLAVAEFKDALLRHRESATAAMGYIDIARRSGRIGEAKTIVKQLFRPNPSDAALAHRRIAEWLVGKDYWYAQYFAQRAHALDPVKYPTAKIEGRGTPMKTTWPVVVAVVSDALPDLPVPDGE